jgi:hypothetical protein
VEYIRRFEPNVIIIPGLGEYQTNTSLRSSCYHKGYLGGQPDLLIINPHRRYQGLAIEFKSPTGKGIVSEKQASYLTKLDQSGYKCIISNDYDEITVELAKYCRGFVFPCRFCAQKKYYKSIFKLCRHYKNYHKVED